MYHKPGIFIYDKVKSEVVIIEVGITSFDNLHTLETEKKRKYDELVNKCKALYNVQTMRIIPYVMTWDAIVTSYHRAYCKE